MVHVEDTRRVCGMGHVVLLKMEQYLFRIDHENGMRDERC